MSILIAIYIYRWWTGGHKILASVLLVLLIVSNLSTIFKENQKGQTLFAIQKDMILTNQLQAVDYTYKKASGETFSTNALTSPLNTNIVWAYLYKWYGQEKYGYAPYWHGPSQVGQVIVLEEGAVADKHFLFIEPLEGIPLDQLHLKIGEENALSKIITETNYESIVVQERSRYE
ncbi:hypothetical protein ACFL2C_00815 [Patescibacteria group bacterium]